MHTFTISMDDSKSCSETVSLLDALFGLHNEYEKFKELNYLKRLMDECFFEHCLMISDLILHIYLPFFIMCVC